MPPPSFLHELDAMYRIVLPSLCFKWKLDSKYRVRMLCIVKLFIKMIKLLNNLYIFTNNPYFLMSFYFLVFLKFNVFPQELGAHKAYISETLFTFIFCSFALVSLTPNQIMLLYHVLH